MKKTVGLLAFLFLGFAYSFAQLTTGVVTYEMNFSSDDPEMSMATSMMAGSSMSLSFSGTKSRSDLAMGMLGTTTTISDAKTGKSLTLMDMMGMKYAIEDLSKQEKPAAPSIKGTDEKMDIAGYSCKKYIATAEDGSETILWCTDQIKAQTSGQQYFSSTENGLPLLIQLTQNNLTVELKATGVEKKVSKKVFKMSIPDGFEKKTAEELQMMGQ